MVDWEIRTGNVRKENHDITKVLPSEGFLKNWKFDIVNDPCFNEANNVFPVMCTKKGKGAVVYNDPINTADPQNLYTLFN